MDASQNLPELVAAAQVTAKASTDRIAEILDHLDKLFYSDSSRQSVWLDLFRCPYDVRLSQALRHL